MYQSLLSLFISKMPGQTGLSSLGWRSVKETNNSEVKTRFETFIHVKAVWLERFALAEKKSPSEIPTFKKGNRSAGVKQLEPVIHQPATGTWDSAPGIPGSQMERTMMMLSTKVGLVWLNDPRLVNHLSSEQAHCCLTLVIWYFITSRL